MNKIDRLIERARPRPAVVDRLKENNPYLGRPLGELLDMMTAGHYTAPPMGTWEWGQFTVALVEAYEQD